MKNVCLTFCFAFPPELYEESPWSPQKVRKSIELSDSTVKLIRIIEKTCASLMKKKASFVKRTLHNGVTLYKSLFFSIRLITSQRSRTSSLLMCRYFISQKDSIASTSRSRSNTSLQALALGSMVRHGSSADMIVSAISGSSHSGPRMNSFAL